MKTLNPAGYPLRAIFTASLMIATLSSTSAYAFGGPPVPGKAAPSAAAGEDPNFQTLPASAGIPSDNALATMRSPKSVTGSSGEVCTTSGAGNKIICTIEVKAKGATSAKRITFEGTLGTEAALPGEILIENGQIKRAQSAGTRTVMRFNIQGCDGSCPPIADLEMIRGTTDTMAAVTDYLKEKAVDIYNEQAEQKVLNKRLQSCQAVRDENGDIVKVTGKNKRELREEILQCQVDAVTQDKSEEKEDELLSLGEVSGQKIGGMLRRAMVSEDEADREWAQEEIEKLSDEHGDDSAAVDAYLQKLQIGADQINRIMELADLSEDNPQARQQVYASLNQAAQAWDPSLQQNQMKGDGTRRAISDIYNLMKSYGCKVVTSGYNAGGAQGAAQSAQNQCNSVDSAINDGTVSDTISQTQPVITPVQQIDNTPRNVRSQNTVTSQPGNQQFYQPNIENPNQTPIPGNNATYSTGINANFSQPGTVRGQRFGN